MQAIFNVTIEVLRSTQEMEQFWPLWQELWRKDPHATPFQSPEWLISWWHHFSQPDLRTVLIWKEDELVGVLPLYIYHDTHSGERQLLLLGAGTSDYLDGIFSAACTPDVILFALRRLRDEADWDVGHFQQVRPHSPLLVALQKLTSEPITFGDGENCWRLAASLQESLPSKLRHDLRPLRKFIAEGANVEYVTADSYSWREFFGALRSLHAERWRRVGEAGVLSDPDVISWHCEALSHLHAAGMVRLQALRVDGRFIAVLYSLVDPTWRTVRTQYCYLIGHTADFAYLSPGTALLAMATEEASQQGVGTIDLLRGEESYKRFWKAQQSPTVAVTWRPEQTHNIVASRLERVCVA